MEVDCPLSSPISYNTHTPHTPYTYIHIKDDIAILSRVDESLIAGLVSAHSKVAKEALFLERGTLPIKYVLAGRTLLYHQTIIKLYGVGTVDNRPSTNKLQHFVIYDILKIGRKRVTD